MHSARVATGSTHTRIYNIIMRAVTGDDVRPRHAYFFRTDDDSSKSSTSLQILTLSSLCSLQAGHCIVQKYKLTKNESCFDSERIT